MLNPDNDAHETDLTKATTLVLVATINTVKWYHSNSPQLNLSKRREEKKKLQSIRFANHKVREDEDDVTSSGERYPQYKCSPPVTGNTHAILTLNGFEKGEDGGGPSECDGDYHNDNDLVVALSTGWYAGGSRCHDFILITNQDNGRTARARVVDECDSVSGCDEDHDFQPPCPNNIVDASLGVWKALGVENYDDVGEMSITWSET
ncbi:hypothetical protein SUGI_0230910 [Cryptomeria japonica]|nr:hypothetical protein SUGI_0230910 [Cryptomeria japonica]